MNDHNIISVSGGKDSTALLLLAIERGAENMQAVFADTGHEHPQTYDYVRYLEQATGVPIRWVRADFSTDIAKKAEFVSQHWKSSLMKGQPGEWDWLPADADADDACSPVNPFTGAPIEMPAEPENPYVTAVVLRGTGRWTWTPAVRALSEDEADAWVQRALDVLKPTGVPFLDLCLWKGRFPSTKARFCSEELKHVPILEQVQLPLLEAGDDVISWQGVRADESLARRHLAENEAKRTYPSGGTLWNYRPILKWTAEDAFAMHRKHGIKHNPLYEQGMGRVGCMPCIHARKDELLEISKRFPEEIARVEAWERLVAEASKRGMATFFSAVQDDPAAAGKPISHSTHGVWRVVEWSKTSRGGRQYDFLRADTGNLPLCSSIYGLCE